MKKKIKYVISADFDPHKKKWSGFSVAMGMTGTHENYHVIYNGICNFIYFPTEREAKKAARKALKEFKNLGKP